MRIEKIHIDGFGVFHDLGIGEIPEGLSVFHGPNEAGKTTLLAFLRSVLFGFPDGRSRENPYLPLKGGVHGGRIVLVGQRQDRYIVDRRPGTHGGDLTVTLPGGQTGDSGVLQRLLGFADRDLYRNVFAFSLKELQRFDTLDNAVVGAAIYSAGAGAGLLSLPEVSKTLEKAMGDIFKPAGSKPIMNRTLKELERCRGAIREKSSRVDDYDRARKELKDAEGEIERLQLQRDENQRKRDRASSRLQVWDEWVALKSCEEELARLPEMSPIPPDALNRLERIEQDLEHLAADVRKNEDDIQALEAERDSLPVNAAVLAREGEILQLQRGRDHYDNVKAEFPLRQQELETAERQVAEILRGIGSEWDVDRLKNFDTSITVREVIRTHRREMEAAEKSRELVEMRTADEERRLDEADKAEKEARTALSELGGAGEQDPEQIQRKREDLRRLLSLVRVQGRLAEKLGGLTERQDDFRGQARRIEDRMGRTGIELPWYPAVPVVLLIFLFSGHVYAQIDRGHGRIFAVVGMVVVSAYLALRWWMKQRGERSRRHLGLELTPVIQRLKEISRERDAVQRECEAVNGEVGDIVSRLEMDPCPDEATVEAAMEAFEAEMDRIRRWRSAEDAVAQAALARTSVVETYEGLKGELQKVEGEALKIRESWEEWLASVGLPADVTPDGALEMVTRVQECREREDMADGLRERIRLMREEMSAYEGRVTAVRAACGLGTEEDADAGATVDRLIVTLKEAQRQANRREAITERLDRLVRETGRLRAERKNLAGKLEALFREAGATTAEDVRRRASIWEARLELERRIGENTRALERIGGRGKHLDAFKADLSETRPEEEKRIKATAEDALGRVSTVLAEQLDRRGALREKLRVMETASDVGALRLEEERLIARLNESARNWARLALAKALLSETGARYERERQPGVIKDAGVHLKKMTHGRYTRIIAPAGETTLHVMDRNDVRRRLEELSRGTREQLYLAVRLGLIEEFCRHHEPLPIVLDDIFVNFDNRRADAAVELIAELAASYQVFVFTCHEDTCRRFSTISPSAPVFEIRDGSVRSEDGRFRTEVDSIGTDVAS